MKITSLTLKNFRNYASIKLSLSPGVNSIVGKNAQGKTNLVEAIYFTCIGKSFRTSREKEMIKFDEEDGYISLIAENEIRQKKIEVLLKKSQKKTVRMDSLPIRRIGDVIGEVPIVFFSPDEMRLVKDSPEERRRFMNIDISQTNRRYFFLLNRYEKILDNRNKLLKSIKDKNVVLETIDIWNRALADTAVVLNKARREFIEEIAPYAQKANEFISGGEVLKISYDGVKEDSADAYIKKLEKTFEKDFNLGYTSYGIHHDDINIYLNDVEVKSFGSQGQQRTAALAMKLAELEYIKSKTGDYPVLILDDVFSELDSERRRRLLKFTSRCQTIITTTDIDNCAGKIIAVESGKMLDKE